MQKLQPVKIRVLWFLLISLIVIFSPIVNASNINVNTINASTVNTTAIEAESTMDRLALVTQQINLLKNRLSQGEQELAVLKNQKDSEVPGKITGAVSKNLLTKAS